MCKAVLLGFKMHKDTADMIMILTSYLFYLIGNYLMNLTTVFAEKCLLTFF